MRVLLTEGSGLTSRQVASRLQAAGHEVGVLSSDPIGLSRFTNSTSAWHRVPAFGSDPFGWLEAAVTTYRYHRYDLLFPTQEQVTVLAACEERLRRDGVATIVPRFEALAAVQDKVAATATLERLGLPQPPTDVLRNRDAVDRFDEFPAFVKFPIGTACSGVGLARSRTELNELIAEWDLLDAFALGGLVAQRPVEGPLAEVQSVFDHGELVGFHVNIRTREGARGGASHKRSILSPATRDVIEGLGNELSWHGALSADVIPTGAGSQIIDINPRLVEPNNAWIAGVDLVEVMVMLGKGEHPPASTLTRPAAWTWFSSGSVSNYAISPRGWRAIISSRAQDRTGGDR